MESILYNYSDIDNITTLLVEDIESYFKKKYTDGYYLNKHMTIEVDQIHTKIYIHKNEENKKYYYYLYAKNFWFKEEVVNDIIFTDEYCLFTSRDFHTVLELLENMKDVICNYTFFDDILCSSKQKEKLQKLKKTLSFFPKEVNECSICYEPTKQVTLCNHPICLHCREACILSQKNNCPICRKEKVLIRYPPKTGLFIL